MHCAIRIVLQSKVLQGKGQQCRFVVEMSVPCRCCCMWGALCCHVRGVHASEASEHESAPSP